MAERLSFQPQWASPPGETISEALRERRLPLAEFAKLIGKPRGSTEKLLAGDIVIDQRLAERLHVVIGGSTAFWLNREAQFRTDLARVEAERRESEKQSWLRGLPVRDMIKFGWIDKPADRAEQVASCLRFFGVPTIEAWQQSYQAVADVVAFRTSNAFEAHPSAVAAWLRRGEIEAEHIKVQPWSKQRLLSLLSDMRVLTRTKDPAVFLPELRRLCAQCGVAMVIARAPTGCRASGATRFLSKDKALVLLSFRYRTDDHFWFTFFHEIGHLVLHDKRALFVEGVGMSPNEEERDADSFSANLLVPSESRDEMLGLKLDYRSVMRFARKVGVSAGIVVGQLQHHGLLERKDMNYLKTRYVWRDE